LRRRAAGFDEHRDAEMIPAPSRIQKIHCALADPVLHAFEKNLRKHVDLAFPRST
jgi:hypothetical protein